MESYVIYKDKNEKETEPTDRTDDHATHGHQSDPSIHSSSSAFYVKIKIIE